MDRHYLHPSPFNLTRPRVNAAVAVPLGAEATKVHVAPTAVMYRQIERKPAVPLMGGLESHGIRPFAQEGLDEPLRFAVRPGYVGPGADRLEL